MCLSINCISNSKSERVSTVNEACFTPQFWQNTAQSSLGYWPALHLIARHHIRGTPQTIAKQNASITGYKHHCLIIEKPKGPEVEIRILLDMSETAKLPKAWPLTIGHQKRQGKISGIMRVNHHGDESKYRRTGPIIVMG